MNEAETISTKIKKCALDYLANREHSRQELLLKLVAKEFARQDIMPVLDDLASKGLQSDKRFAEMFVRVRVGRGFGPVHIDYELRTRGVAPEIITVALAESDMSWLSLAVAARQKKFGMQLPSDFDQRVKQQRYLQYKGFDFAQINAVFKAAACNASIIEDLC